MTEKQTAADGLKPAYEAAESDRAQKMADDEAAKLEYEDELKAYNDALTTDSSTSTLPWDGALTLENGYSYKLIYNYNRNTPVPTPTPTPVPTPVPTNPPPVVIPDDPVPTGPRPVVIIDDDVPMGTPTKGKSRTRRSLYTILDDDVPLGALPNTSGSRGAAVGGLGAFLLAAGAILGLTKKRKKDDEE